MLSFASASIWPVSIILRPVVQSNVQPRHSGPGGAEPNRLATEPSPHRTAHALPKGVFLRLGRSSNEGRQVAIRIQRSDRTRYDHDRVLAQIRKLDHAAFVRAAEVLGESVGIRFCCQPGA